MERQPESFEATPPLLRLEKAYKIEASLNEGERALAELAKSSKREYAWAFDEVKSIWIYYPTEVKVHINPEEGSVRHELTLPPELWTPPTENSVHYHIHPTSDLFELMENPKEGWSRDLMLAKNPLPSGEDISSAAKMTDAGYKGFRIVTPIGVTSISFYRERMTSSEFVFPDFTITQDEILNVTQNRGLVGIESAVRMLIERLNKHFGGVFEFDFRLLDKE